MRLGLGIGLGMFRAAGIVAVPQQWIIDGSEVQQSPDGPSVIWSVNGSNVSYIEV